LNFDTTFSGGNVASASPASAVSSAPVTTTPNSTQVNYSKLLQVINLGYCGHDVSPLATNQLYVQNCFLPVFNIYKSEIGPEN